MDRLNAVPGVTIGSTCAGHPERASGPSFTFTTVDGRGGYVESELVNTGRNHAALLAWWESAIDRLENDLATLLAEASAVHQAQAKQERHRLATEDTVRSGRKTLRR